jgi:hypothetical protein
MIRILGDIACILFAFFFWPITLGFVVGYTTQSPIAGMWIGVLCIVLEVIGIAKYWPDS